MMLRLLEHDNCFEVPRSTGASRDQTAGQNRVSLGACICAAKGIRCMSLLT